jgi:hypothetical protein
MNKKCGEFGCIHEAFLKYAGKGFGDAPARGY